MSETAGPSRNVFVARLLIGLAQGAAVFVLAEWSRRSEGRVEPRLAYDVLFVLALVIPPSLLGAVGRLGLKATLIWLGGAVVAAGGLAAHQSLQSTGPSDEPVWIAAALAPPMFVAFQLLCAGLAERRWRASYPRYFDGAWLDGVRIAFAVAFTGAMWAVLQLAAALFALIGIEAVRNLIGETVFAAPATTLAFAAGVHLTDVRVGLVRGVRTVGLTLLGWLAPLMGLVAIAFLASLPFTGLEPLWDTGTAAGLLLSAAAALIILLNAVYQDGEDEDHPPKALRWAGRAVALAVAPLVLIAGYAVALRVGQYGLTPERVLALAALLVGLVYGAGYAWAAVSRGRWLARLEGTNIQAAWLGVGVVLAIMSPLADPRRLSVADQVGRLERGEIEASAFDYKFLASGAGRHGRDALARIENGAAGDDAAARARKAVEYVGAAPTTESPVPKLSPSAMASAVTVLGAVAPPESFFEFVVDEPALARCARVGVCQALTGDIGGEAGPEVIVFQGRIEGYVYGRSTGAWRQIGSINFESCRDFVRAVEEAEIADDASWRDVIVDGRRRRIVPITPCPEDINPPAAPSTPPPKPPTPEPRSVPRP